MDYKNEGTACPGNWLVIYDNYNGKEKEVSFDIDNKGACPVMVRVGKKKHETPEGGSKEIPGKTKVRAAITLPEDCYLFARCISQSDTGCDWTISDIRP